MKDKDLLLAKCRVNAVPTSMFFEDFETLSMKEKKNVLSMCKDCLVKDKCLDDAFSHKDTYGVWGGQFFKRGRPMRINATAKKKTSKTLT